MSLAALFESGRAADIILGVLAIEALLLVLIGRRRVADVALALLPGALMIVALRLALTGAHWAAVAVPLALSFPVHLADLRRRGLLAPRSARP